MTTETTGVPAVVTAPPVVVVPTVQAVPVVVSAPPPATYPPLQPVVMLKQDPSITREIKIINWLLFAFAILHFIGAVLFLAGNAAALNGPFVANLRYRDGLRVNVSGATIMCVAAIILFTAHVMDLVRSRKLGITNFLVYSSVIVSFAFFIGFLFWAIGFGLLLESWHDRGQPRENSRRAAGLDIITIGTFIAAIGIFHAFVGHWGALEARSRNRVSHHTFSPSHLRAWAMSAGNFDFMIGWVIYVVASLAAAVNANNYANYSFLYELFIVGIITSIFFLLGDIRTLYITWPTRAIYTDMVPFGGPGVAAVSNPVAAV